jgi:hypothetical protein
MPEPTKVASQSTHSDASALEEVVRATQPEEHLERKSAELAKKYPPELVPYLNDDYTYAERQQELELVEALLTQKLLKIRGQLQTIREINRTRTYPNIAFQEQTKG